MKYSRRHTLKSLLLGATATAAGSNGDAIPAASQPSTLPNQPPTAPLRWARGKEGQRKADLGNDTFLNPIMAGDHPDPSILKDGAAQCASFDQLRFRVPLLAA